MKSFRQMLRQPVKFIAGLILMTVAASIVCVSVGQALAAQNTMKELENKFTTVAVPAPVNPYKISINGIKQDLEHTVTSGSTYVKESLQWLEETAQSNPEIVKTIAKHGIMSAYIPQLTPLNYTQGDFIPENFGTGNNFFYSDNPDEPSGMPYSCAMLVITLDEVSEPVATTRTFYHEYKSFTDFPTIEEYFEWQENLTEKETVTAGYTISLAGAVTAVVSLQEGYRDPTGMTARLTMTTTSLEELEALNLQPGESYLVYGMDYYDEDWALRGYLADERHRVPRHIDNFDLNKLRYLTEKEKYYINTGIHNDTFFEAYNNEVVAFYDGSIEFTQKNVDQINAISMTLDVPVSSFNFEAIRDEDGNLLEIKTIAEVTYMGRTGEFVSIPHEEYISRYQIPTIVRLDGSVEEFLQSEKGAFWQEALDRDYINNHAFPVIGVDQLEYLMDFAREESCITQGRDFTAKELKSGAKVCIIHERVAAESGLTVGDTISLNLYYGDLGLPYEECRNDQFGGLTPAADFYFRTTPIQETAEYTIVGTYRSRDLWTDVANNEYGLSPNTVIVPNTSVETPMVYPAGIVFNTVVLQNGRQEDFDILSAEAGYRGQFSFYDQGYTDIAGNFHDYDALARQVLTVGASVYAVILLLFLLLFPGTQGKSVRTMESLGTTRWKRFRHVILSSVCVAAPATVLGGGIGVLLWQKVLDALQTSAESALALQLDFRILLLLALVQFALAMALSTIIAVCVTAPRSLSRRRSK